MKKLTIADIRNLLSKVHTIEENMHHTDPNFLLDTKKEILQKMNLKFEFENLRQIKEKLEKDIETIKSSSDYWNTDLYKENAENNSKCVMDAIDDIDFSSDKVMICGRGTNSHPDFFPRFSTPTTNIDSTLYVTVDHDPAYADFITRKGNYAVCLIVDPLVPKKITEVGGKIYWFSPDFLNYDIPKISIGKIPRGNSGLAAISLASYLKVKSILLSGIKFTDHYKQFIDGQKLVFDYVSESGSKIYSLDGILAEQLTIEQWNRL
jgi:hypothetical protein